MNATPEWTDPQRDLGRINPGRHRLQSGSKFGKAIGSIVATPSASRVGSAIIAALRR
jgi:hypothetical protein